MSGLFPLFLVPAIWTVIAACGAVLLGVIGYALLKVGESSSGSSGGWGYDESYEEEKVDAWNPIGEFLDSVGDGLNFFSTAREEREERNEAIREQQEWDDYDRERRERYER